MTHLSPLPVQRQPRRDRYDAVVVGSGPNGLAAAITLARAGRTVVVLEGAETIGGGMRSAELTLPGFVHDVCSAIHPLGIASPLFRNLPLADFGLEWIQPPAPVAHPQLDGAGIVVQRSLEETARRLGADGPAYRRLLTPLVERADALLADTLKPLGVPAHPLLLARFGWQGMRSAQRLVKQHFRQTLAPGLFAGMAGHSILPIDRPLTAAVGLMFCMTAHHRGWPLPRGGSQSIADAMGRYLASLGGELVVGHKVNSRSDCPAAKAILLDTSPREMLRILGHELPAAYRQALTRFRHGPGVFKLDWALEGPIPWRHAECAHAGTVHVGGTFEAIAAGERAAWEGRVSDEPLVLVAQQSLFDECRAPPGKHTGWGYCHVPHGCTLDMTERIEAQIERFAPGFRQRILARHVSSPADLERSNPNYPGGDITGGVMAGWQMFARPTLRRVPYSTPLADVFLCSASTPPGAGVHGMCGYHAARAALAGVLRG